MQITQRNYNRIMKIDDLARRKAKLQELCLSIGFHGGLWQEAMQELKKLEKQGVKTALELRLMAENRA